MGTVAGRSATPGSRALPAESLSSAGGPVPFLAEPIRVPVEVGMVLGEHLAVGRAHDRGGRWANSASSHTTSQSAI